jgi:hypothetical protein
MIDYLNYWMSYGLSTTGEYTCPVIANGQNFGLGSGLCFWMAARRKTKLVYACDAPGTCFFVADMLDRSQLFVPSCGACDRLDPKSNRRTWEIKEGPLLARPVLQAS